MWAWRESSNAGAGTEGWMFLCHLLGYNFVSVMPAAAHLSWGWCWCSAGKGALLWMHLQPWLNTCCRPEPGADQHSCTYRCGAHPARCAGTGSDSLFRQGRQAEECFLSLSKLACVVENSAKFPGWPSLGNSQGVKLKLLLRGDDLGGLSVYEQSWRAFWKCGTLFYAGWAF